MRRLMEWLRQGLCQHEWQELGTVGYESRDGWLVAVKLRECRRCGKTERV